MRLHQIIMTKLFVSATAASSNKRMQSDQNARYALILTADAGSYTAASGTLLPSNLK